MMNPGCASYNEKGICTSCSEEYQFVHYDSPSYIGYCEEARNCAKINDSYCVACESHHTLSSYGYCLLNWNCTETDAEGHCTKCDDGTTLSSELLCEENKECSNISNDTCTKCIEGYSLNEYKICKEDFNCSVFDENSQCIECEEGSTFNSNTNKCEYDPYCLEVNSSSRLCTKYSEGYTLSTAWYHYYECIKDDNIQKSTKLDFVSNVLNITLSQTNTYVKRIMTAISLTSLVNVLNVTTQ